MSQLNILICSGNLGNKQPTSESFGSWVPCDGDIQSVVNKTIYPLANSKKQTQGAFDVIVIGMQESTFSVDGVDETSQDESRGDESDQGFKDDVITSLERELFRDCASTCDSSVSDSTVDSLSKDDIEKYPKNEKHNSKGHKKIPKVAKVIRSVTASEDHTLIGSKSFQCITNANRDEKEAVNKKRYEEDTIVLYNLVKNRCPSYDFVVNFLHGEMRLMVLVRKDIVMEVNDVETKAVSTGIGSVLANKGGVVSYITIRKTRMAFITAHLEAHEGQKHYFSRCANLESILNGSKERNSRYDATISTHHCFVCGDLNYRLVVQQENFSRKEHLKWVEALIKKKQWAKLMEFEELNNALRNFHCLTGFRTLKCRFPPTFKVLRGQVDFVYNPQRIPSYTDRILWNSADGLQDNVEPFVYEPCQDFITSDHKPIRGAFTVTTNSPKQTRVSRFSILTDVMEKIHQYGHLQTNANVGTKTATHLFITDLVCTNLKHPNAKCINPYVTFVTNPEEHLCRSNECKRSIFPWNKNNKHMTMRFRDGWPSTKVIKSNSNPSWENKEYCIKINTSVEDMALTGAMLYLTVMNYDFKKKDNHFGTVRLSLKELCSIERRRASMYDSSRRGLSNSTTSLESSLKNIMNIIEVNQPILKLGMVHGYLHCKVQAFHFSMGVDCQLPLLDVNGRKNKRNLSTKGVSRRSGLYQSMADPNLGN